MSFFVSVLIPAYRQNYRQCLRSWDGENVEIMLSYDDSSKELTRLTPEEKSTFKATIREFTHNFQETHNIVYVWNYLASLCEGDAMMAFGDDVFCTYPEWREQVLEKIPNFLTAPWCVNIECNASHRWETVAHPLVSRPYYNLFNYIFNPLYTGYMCDYEIYAVASELGMLYSIYDFDWYTSCNEKDVHTDVAHMAMKKTWNQAIETWNQKKRIGDIIKHAKELAEKRGYNVQSKTV